MLEIKDLVVSVEGKRILDRLNLNIKKGEVHAIMGPNGSGKSTLANVLAGNQNYEVESGQIIFQGEDISKIDIQLRAVKGIFMAFQYPVEIPGVPIMVFLREMITSLREERGQRKLKIPEFSKLVYQKVDQMGIDRNMLRRELNVGFSGGEKKRFEILQMMLFEPQITILDETDSGLDIDALKIVANGVNANRHPDKAFLIITHYQRMLNYIVPDKVHVMTQGKIRKTGGKELALELEKNGYENYI